MQGYLLMAALVSILTLVIYFSLGWLNEKKSKPVPNGVMTVLRFILFFSVGLMLLAALTLV